jgi:hypothetical protein
LKTVPNRSSRTGQKGTSPLTLFRSRTLRLPALELTLRLCENRINLHPRVLTEFFTRLSVSRSWVLHRHNRSLRHFFTFSARRASTLDTKRRNHQSKRLCSLANHLSLKVSSLLIRVGQQVRFHPTIPHLLFAASRQSNHLEVFDLRNFSLEPVKLARRGRTNQRLGVPRAPVNY